jgi:membrane dipeptidase
MRNPWEALGTPTANRADGAVISVTGFPVAPAGRRQASRFLLTREAPCCPGCAPATTRGRIVVETRVPVPMTAGALRLSGTWRVDDQGYHLTNASMASPPGWAGLTRRAALAGPLICLPGATKASAAEVIRTGTPIDLHSHAGGIANVARMHSGLAFGPVFEPMRKGGMTAISLAIVSDGPTHKLMADHRLHPFRDPDLGELHAYGQLAFARVHAMAHDQGLAIATSAADLRPGAPPRVIIAAEGADFLEGHVERVDEAYAKWSLRHLQLTHYRVNELGDIQTEPPVHGGLTDTGAEVIRRCNRLGIVVDVAHGTFDLVKRAVSVTTKPLVLSHTSLTNRPGQFSRQITAEHARLIAGTGGVIGVWPPETIYPTLDAMAAGMARLVGVVGVDHVGLGSDMRGLVSGSVFPDYDRLPDLADALLKAGFNATESGKILGGNYLRVFTACTGAA